MVQTFCKSGANETVKGAVHAAGAVLAAVMATYNIAAWCYRREHHLGINVIVYTLATAWEVRQTVHHLERSDIPGLRDENAA
jgi:predicted membrane channel-forming protein YqfA (hemolysin III family)